MLGSYSLQIAAKRLSKTILLLASMSVVHASDDLQTGIDAFNRGDLPGAMAAYRRAAENGSDEAQVRLAWILDQAEENAEAVKWYRLASETGNVDGHAGLAEMYAKGEGVARDASTAVRLYKAAANRGHLGAIRVLTSAYRKGELGLEADEEQAAYWARREQQEIQAKEQQEVTDATR